MGDSTQKLSKNDQVLVDEDSPPGDFQRVSVQTAGKTIEEWGPIGESASASAAEEYHGQAVREFKDGSDKDTLESLLVSPPLSLQESSSFNEIKTVPETHGETPVIPPSSSLSQQPNPEALEPEQEPLIASKKAVHEPPTTAPSISKNRKKTSKKTRSTKVGSGRRRTSAREKKKWPSCALLWRGANRRMNKTLLWSPKIRAYGPATKVVTLDKKFNAETIFEVKGLVHADRPTEPIYQYGIIESSLSASDMQGLFIVAGIYAYEAPREGYKQRGFNVVGVEIQITADEEPVRI